MYPDELATTEAVLRAYPDALADKAAREEYLQGLCAGGSVGDDVHVDGGSGVSAGDRYAMAADKDARLRRARRIVAAVRCGMKLLNHNENRVTHAVYFEGLAPAAAAAQLHLSTSYVRSLVDAARTKLAPSCIAVYADVCALREALREERLDVLRKQEARE